jgi:hypothetical protein
VIALRSFVYFGLVTFIPLYYVHVLHASKALGNSALTAMLLGGARFATPRHIWWNFVASSQERIDLAKDRWARRQFPPVPGETEFIPLPAAW